MKTYVVVYEQNGNEYTGHLEITCNEIEVKDDRKTIIADGVEIVLDEKIIEIY